MPKTGQTRRSTQSGSSKAPRGCQGRHSGKLQSPWCTAPRPGQRPLVSVSGKATHPTTSSRVTQDVDDCGPGRGNGADLASCRGELRKGINAGGYIFELVVAECLCALCLEFGSSLRRKHENLNACAHVLLPNVSDLRSLGSAQNTRKHAV